MREIIVQWRGNSTTNRYTIDVDGAWMWDDARVRSWLTTNFPDLIVSWWTDC